MAILKTKELAKMTLKERKEKLKELRMELIRANVAVNKTNAKTKEIKKAIARLVAYNTFNKSLKEEELNKK